MSKDYDIICLTETHLDNSFVSRLIFDPNDKIIFRKDRNKHGGGVLVAVNAELKHTLVTIEPDNCEIVAINLLHEQDFSPHGSLLCYYRLPSKLRSFPANIMYE